MQKKFISNLIFILILNIVVKPLSIFGIDASVQNTVGAKDYGLYFSLLNLSFLFTIILDLGINNYTTRHVAQYPHIVSRYMGKILTFRLFLFFGYALLTVITALFLGFKFEHFWMLALLLLNQLFVVFIAYFRSHFSGLLLFKTDAIISILDRLFLILVGGYILFYSSYKISIERFILIQTVTYFSTFLIAFVALIYKIGLPKFSLQWAFSIAIVKKSLPFALLFLLMTVYTRSDVILLERVHSNGAYEAGVYAQGYRLLDAIYMFGLLFANLLLPLFSSQIRKRESVLPLLKLSGEILLGGAFVSILLLITNAQYILDLIYSDNVSETIFPFQLLMISFFGMTFTLIFGTLITANGSLKHLNRIAFIGCFLNIGLNVFMIPKFGATGAAFVSVVTQIGLGILQFLTVFKLFQIKFNWGLFLKYCFFIISLLFIFYFFDNQLNFIIQLVIGISSLIVFKMINIKEILIILKSKE